jgi:hypothetical protein
MPEAHAITRNRQKPPVSDGFPLLRSSATVPLRGAPHGRGSAPAPHETANGEIEADQHHERDKPLIALGRTVRDDKHAAVVDVRRAPPQEGENF